MKQAKHHKQGSGELDELREAYNREYARAERLAAYASEQLSSIIQKNGISLGVPMEIRVKTWSSIEGKINRKTTNILKIDEIQDFVGLRAITLFRRDEESLIKLIEENFDVISNEDTSERLDESEFGYQSQHFIVRLKSEWIAAPTVSDLGERVIEIQVRTLAQHIWAAASHKLQYKSEDSVPLLLRRSIYRASALLEIVDLEFERLLDQRESYIKRKIKSIYQSDTLDVDLVEIVAREKFPKRNAEDDEAYDAVLSELRQLGVLTVGALEDLIDKHYPKVMHEEKVALDKFGSDELADHERTLMGVFYNLVGLLRQTMVEEYGEARVRSIVTPEDDEVL